MPTVTLSAPPFQEQSTPRSCPPLPRRRVRRKHRDIAFVTIGIDDALVNEPAIATALWAIEQVVESSGRGLLVANIPAADRVPPFLTHRMVDGVIVRGPDRSGPSLMQAGGLLAQLERIPHVWLMGRPAGTHGDSCSFDANAVGELAAEHLHACGHRNLAFFSAQPAFTHLAAVKHAFFATSAQLHCKVSSFECHGGSPVIWPISLATDPQDMDRLVTRCLASSTRDPITGIFVAGDRCARQIYHSLRQRTCRIGADVSVMFCGTDHAILSDMEPSPTTIELNADVIGMRAAAELLWRVAHPNQRLTVQVLVQPSLLPGASVGQRRFARVGRRPRG